MSVKGKFASMVYNTLGQWVADVGHEVRKEGLPIPAEYDLGIKIVWNRADATVTATIGAVAHSSTFSFAHSPIMDINRRFADMASKLWSAWLEKNR